jgi:1-deoxy-D-xylulose-5-phosphate synthase
MKTSSILDRIDSPADLKKLTPAELVTLAAEIRETIIQTVSRVGGHLGASLGVVELTIALHYCLDSPRDKLIWDVSHQCYPHKLLTGRREQFHTLRQYGGLRGFTSREESEHDHFGTGHSSTSISAALGIATARDLQGEDYRVVAIIGDGAMTGGLAYEAMNNAGQSPRPLIVVLNDNEMSIERNVGAMPRYLNRLITGKIYNEAHREIRDLLNRMSPNMFSLARRLRESLKGLIVPGMLFEELGFRYFGPIDGHNLPALISTLNKVRDMRGPILLHVITKKGKGYAPSENDPVRWHGATPFCIETGEVEDRPGPPTYTQVFGETLCDFAEERADVLAITAAMIPGTGLSEFARRFPERCFDVGIAESHAVTFAAGLAAEGLRPVVAIYSTFLQRAYDQIIHDVALQRLPVIFAIDRGGLVGQDGPTHHGIFDLSFLRMIPELVVMAPKDEAELRDMMLTALMYEKGPTAIRYPRAMGAGADLTVPPRQLEIGRAEVVREGEQVVFFAIGRMVHEAVRAAELLAADGIEVGVVNARFVKPLDEELLVRLARRYRHIVTVEDNVIAGGFGSAALEALCANGVMSATCHCLGLPDQFVEQGETAVLFDRYDLSAPRLADRVKAVLGIAVPIGENVVEEVK